MRSNDWLLTDPDGPPYTEREVREIQHLRDPGTLGRWRKMSTAPPFYRNGRKHSRVLYPRREFSEWFGARTYRSQAEAQAAER
jgi:hypothetical protein